MREPITYHVAAFDRAEATEIAYAVHAGRLGHREHYLTPEGAGAIRDHLNRLCSKRREVFEVQVDRRATHDGVIPVAWAVDQIGKAALSAALLYAGCWLVGWGTLL